MRVWCLICLLLLTGVAVAEDGPSLGIRPALGVMFQPPGGPGASLSTPGRLQVREVLRDSVAEKMDLKTGDVIQTVNGNGVASVADLRKTLADIPIGEEVVIEYMRGTARQTARGDWRNTKYSLKSYIVTEGRGIVGVVELGDSLTTVTASLGPPVELEKITTAVASLPTVIRPDAHALYPHLGIYAVFRRNEKDEATCSWIILQFPFLGQTKKGVLTNASEKEVLEAYGPPVASQETPNGAKILLYPLTQTVFQVRDGVVELMFLFSPDSMPPIP